MSLPPKQRVSPLNWREPIVNPDGTPSQQFIRLWQTMFGNGENVDAEVQQLIDAQLQPGSGIAITPDGHLLSNPTIAAEVQPILDQITDVHGSVLYRDSTGWAHLPPGTAGQFLQTQGAGADPLWATAGGGGGFTPTAPPIASTFTSSGTATSTLTDIGSPGAGALLLGMDGIASRNTGFHTQTVVPGAGGYELIVGYSQGSNTANDYTLLGIGARDPSETKYAAILDQYGDGQPNGAFGSTSFTAIPSGLTDNIYLYQVTQYRLVKLVYDISAATLTFFQSFDFGSSWTYRGYADVSGWATGPTLVGFVMHSVSSSSSQIHKMLLDHWVFSQT